MVRICFDFYYIPTPSHYYFVHLRAGKDRREGYPSFLFSIVIDFPFYCNSENNGPRKSRRRQGNLLQQYMAIEALLTGLKAGVQGFP
jgi:hypothetical protein